MTNPGEWPWAVLIFRGETYVGAGVLLDNNLVATTATKVREGFTKKNLKCKRFQQGEGELAGLEQSINFKALY